MSVYFTDFGLALCAAGFAVLAIGLRPQSVVLEPSRVRLRWASAWMVVWSIAAAVFLQRGGFDPALTLLFSLALIAVWTWQLAPLARWLGLARPLQLLLEGGGWFMLASALAWMLAAARAPEIPPPSVTALTLPGIALSAVGLFTIEQLYRAAPIDVQQALRWLVLGMGGVLVTELVVLSESLVLGQQVFAPGAARGILYALCAGAMVHGARQLPQWVSGVAVSRQLAFYATSFLLIGAYLVLMALAGWLTLRYGEEWGTGRRVVFALLAAAGLAVPLFSSGLLRRLRVFITTHFYAQRYDYRVEWMRFTRTMSEADPRLGVPQRAIQALAQIAGSLSGTLWRRTGNQGDFHCAAGWPQAAPELPPVSSHDALPAYLQRTAWLVDLAELARRPDLYGGLQVEPTRIGATPDALIVPLLHVDLLHGWIVLARAPGKAELDFEDRDLLKIAGRHVAAHLAQLDADAQLVEARQFETYNRMTAFVMHDLKNIAAQLRLLSQNAERHGRNMEFVDDAFRTVSAAASRMTKLIAQLASGREAGTMQTVDLAGIAERAIRRSGGEPVPQLVADARCTVFADAEHLCSIIEHAIRNAQDATQEGGEVRIEVAMRDQRPVLSVVDTGAGMDARFVRERLFRPFDTTKGSRGMGIGAFQIREYLRSLGGDVEVESEPGRGTRLTMVFADPSVLATAREAG